MDLPYELCKHFCHDTQAIVKSADPTVAHRFAHDRHGENISGQMQLSMIVADHRDQTNLITR